MRAVKWGQFSVAKPGSVFQDGSGVHLFAGFHVKDYASAFAWYERLFGCPPAFRPTEKEAVWELAQHRYAFIKVLPEHAGHAFNVFFLDDLDGFVAQIAERGLEPAMRKTLSNGVRKVIYHDPDGNEIGFGGAPQVQPQASKAP
jgi:predicted enzyme related to lactoylglutathione lyase